jgi:predicted MPP superfamily phosphohydrolase
MKQFIPLLFFAVFIGILTAANIYLVRRFNFYFSIENTRILYFVFPVLSLFMFFGMMPLTNSTSSLGSFIYISAAITMGVLLYLVLATITVDLASLLLKLNPRTTGISVITITLLVSAAGIFNSRNTKITQHEFKIQGLSKEIRAMHLSDIHIGHFRGKNFLNKIVEKTNKENVDVVFITGDLFDGKINLTKKELLPLTRLKMPVYFVEGNHDRYTDIATIKKYLREINVKVLENEISDFGELQVIGLNHMRADSLTYDMHAAGNHSTIQSVLDTLQPGKDKPSVLLHHSPDGIKYANQHGVDLYLAGHTHAGQLFPIMYIANLIFEYNRGVHNFNGTKLFVSQGAGTFGPPMRLGTKSEITVITLKPV